MWKRLGSARVGNSWRRNGNLLLLAGGNGRACIFVEVPLDEVDVNVSPTKSEVRFKDSELVKNTVILGIKMAIGNSEDRLVAYRVLR